MNSKVDKYIESHKEEMLSLLYDFLKIDSEKRDAIPNAPFGKGVDDALKFILKAAKNMGFAVTDMDGYVGCIDYGSGDELLGVLCHVDVVPKGDGWKYPPYSATVVDGKIFARGAIDDKGPAVSALYALAAVKEASLKTKRRIRIMLGCDEESGWGCMEHYKKHAEIPHISFSPDGEYPVVYSEKGIMQICFKRDFISQITFDSGSRSNVIPNSAVVTVPFEKSEVLSAVDRAKLDDFPVEVSEIGDKTQFTVTGKGAHASMPWFGKNALSAAICILNELPLSGIDKQVVSNLFSLFKMEYHGQSLGLDYQDESGRITVNPGIMQWDNNGIHNFSTDMRCPTSRKLKGLFDEYSKKMAAFGLVPFEQELKEGLFVPKDSELVAKLLDVYEKRTGKKEEPLAIGGGTYARAFENSVAFGCEDPTIEETAHMPNEYITIDDMMKNTYLIADAIIALACKED